MIYLLQEKYLALLGTVMFMVAQNTFKKIQAGLLYNKLDYSGYDRDSCKLQTYNVSKIHSQQYLKASTKAMRKSVVSQYGVRYSLLIQLPYFECM